MPLKKSFFIVAFCAVIGLLGLSPVMTQVSGQAVAEKSSDQANAAADKAKQEAKAERRKKNQESAHFMRIRKDAKGRAVALETSITRYEKNK